MFDRTYYTKEDAKRAFQRKVRELKREYGEKSINEDSNDEYDRIEIDYLVTNGTGKDSEYFDTEDDAIDFAMKNGWDEIYKITTKYKNGRFVNDSIEPIDW